MASLGKRYVCEKCGTEVLCTRNTDTLPSCCGQEMAKAEDSKRN